jgi:tetratricopeptide (TPR) repeat protein
MPHLKRSHDGNNAHAPVQSHGRGKDFLALIFLAALTLAVYSNSFRVPFLFDGELLTKNFALGQVWPWQSSPTVKRNMVMIDRPVGFFTFGLNYALGQDDPWGFHAGNVAIHILAGWLLYGIVRRTLASRSLAGRYADAARPIAFAAAALWLVHPLQTQSVTYLYQRFESLTGLFYLATLYCFVRAQATARPTAWYVASVAACALGAGTKEVIATAPLVVLWYDRALVAASWREIARSRWAYYTALAGTWGIVALLMMHSAQGFSASGVFFVKGLTPLTYALSQPGVLVHYLRLSFWPSDLCFDYDWPVAHGAAEIVPQAVLIGALAAATVWCIFHRPALGFLGGCFFLILAPTSSIAPLKDLAVEHRMYLPLAAVVVLAVLAGYEVWRATVLRPAAASAKLGALSWLLVPGLPLGVICCVLGYRTWLRNVDYQDEFTIWDKALQMAPHNARAFHNRGIALNGLGELRRAVGDISRALEIDPDFPDAYVNRAKIYRKLGERELELKDLTKATEANVNDVQAHLNRAETCVYLRQYAEARRDYDEVLRIQPNFEVVLNARAWLLATCPDAQVRCGSQAVTDASNACELAKWKRPEFLDTLAATFAEQGDFKKAVLTETKAIRLVPRNKAAIHEFEHRLELYRAGKPFRDQPEATGNGP